MRVPFFRPYLTNGCADAVAQALQSKQLDTGPRVAEFTVRVADLLGVDPEYVVATSSCTAALEMAFRIIQGRMGRFIADIPANTWISTASSVLASRNLINLCDIDPETGMMIAGDEESVVVPVHLYGARCECPTANHKFVVEDCAHALGAPWLRGYPPPNTFRALSFASTKPVTTIQGGLLVCPTVEDAAEANLIGNLGARDRVGFRPGYRFNLDDVGAALGIAQLRLLESKLRAHKLIAQTYLESDAIRKRAVLPDRDLYHLFPVLVDDRDGVVRRMAASGIETSIHYHSLARSPAYGGAHCPAADDFCSRVLSLPMFPGMTPEQMEFVVARFEEVV